MSVTAVCGPRCPSALLAMEHGRKVSGVTLRLGGVRRLGERGLSFIAMAAAARSPSSHLLSSVAECEPLEGWQWTPAEVSV